MKSKRSYTRTMKVVRRVHMYTGLILLPWVLFFGFSGMLFNHPEWLGSADIVASHSAAKVDKTSPFPPIIADEIADRVIEELNTSPESPQYKRVSEKSAVIEGTISFQCETEQGQTSVILSPNRGSARIRVTPPSESAGKLPIDGQSLSVELFDEEKARKVASALLEESGLTPAGPLELSSRGGAEVRFSIESPDGGTPWNVSYSLSENKISSRESGIPQGTDFYSIASRLHKTHHYPDRIGARWLWTVLADATGITMVFWGISGAFMWWQIKPTRLLGIAGLSVAAVLAVVIFSGTYADRVYTSSGGRGGPGRSPGKGGESSRAPGREMPREKGKPKEPNESNKTRIDPSIQTSQ